MKCPKCGEEKVPLLISLYCGCSNVKPSTATWRTRLERDETIYHTMEVMRDPADAAIIRRSIWECGAMIPECIYVLVCDLVGTGSALADGVLSKLTRLTDDDDPYEWIKGAFETDKGSLLYNEWVDWCWNKNRFSQF